MKLIQIDQENNAEDFWDNIYDLRNAGKDVPQEIMDEAIVSDDRADEIEAWCEGIEGYEDGPDHARTALLFTEI